MTITKSFYVFVANEAAFTKVLLKFLDENPVYTTKKRKRKIIQRLKRLEQQKYLLANRIENQKKAMENAVKGIFPEGLEETINFMCGEGSVKANN